MSVIEQQKALSGTYILVLHLRKRLQIIIGSLGTFAFQRGYYLYIGSAFGPGGLSARIRRHLRQGKKNHWHIDYLLAEAAVIDVWSSTDNDKHECGWARIIEGFSGLQLPIPGFGSSDCTCASHLFYSIKKPQLRHYQLHLDTAIKRWCTIK